ncbi:TPA: hypothetical protein ACPOKA_001179 [Haemophilus influenzae]
MPSLVTLISAPLAAGVMVKPSLVISVFAPFPPLAVASFKVMLVKPVKVSFSE